MPRIKTSEGKLSLPGRKQVFRAANAAGTFYGDLIGLADEGITGVTGEFRPAPAAVTPLLAQHVKAGHLLTPRVNLGQSRERFLEGFARLEERYKDLERPDAYPVRYTAALKAMLISEKLLAEKRQS